MSGSIGRPSTILSSLIAKSYLPRQIPPAITTRNFALFCEKNFADIEKQTQAIIRKTTQYATFTIPRGINTRKQLALVHPISQLGVSLLITKHRNIIRNKIRRSRATVFSAEPSENASRPFKGILFNTIEQRRLSICAQSPIVLNADISRCFYTIYTHSIPWAIIGKGKVKTWLRGSKSEKNRLKFHWSNDFDTALQSCQSRETLGLPVGPDTSHLIAEIVLTAIEEEPKLRELLKNNPSMRLVDDFTIGFDINEDAQIGLGVVRDALWEYNLQLNDLKTKIIPTTSVYEDHITLVGRLFLISEKNKNQQRHGITRVLNLTLDQCKQLNDPRPAEIFYRRMQNLGNKRWNLPLILQSIFRLGRDYPSSISAVVEFLINNRDLIIEEGLVSYLETWLRKTLARHLNHAHDFEISWILIAAGIFNIRLSREDINGTFDVGSVPLAILGLLRQRRLLAAPMSEWGWRKAFNAEKIFQDDWLFYYEAVNRGWTKDGRIVKAVKSDPILSMMLAVKVTFLNDRFFDAGFVDVKKRVFRPRKPPVSPRPPSKGLRLGRLPRTQQKRDPRLRLNLSFFPYDL